MAGRRDRITAYLLGVGSVLVVEVAVAAAVLVPPTVAVAGHAQPEPPAATRQVTAKPPPATTPPPGPPAPAPPAPAPGPPAPAPAPAEAPAPAVRTAPSGQRPGTIRLPDGGTATLVRKQLGPGAVLPVPDDLSEATWWGAGLGAPSGASVFAGHVNWKGRTGPFAELWDVRVGERVTVSDAGGKVWTYRVAQIITLHKDALPARASELFAQSGRHRIVLVTCGGRWLGGNTGYAENRVVVAEPS
ncbi:class F sortase [Prauserella oleivorans]|uniref:Class F sortase n=1 Tax=Prauserella oleivorans TaxID=1478153 RepID=A0ABW5W6Z6_9PSEU